MKNGLFRKEIVLGIIILFVGASVIPSMGNPIVVRHDLQENKATFKGINSRGYIQDLIDNASDGDTIYIPSGIYYENIIINKAINLIGEDKDTTIIDGGGIDDVVKITGDWVNISGFTIQKGGKWDDAGIHISSNYNTILGNIITLNDAGIRLNGDYNTITVNTISNNGCGISLGRRDEYGGSNNNTIKGNVISNNGGYGIILSYSSGNNITSNTISKHWDSITLWNSNNNHISDNSILDNLYGISLSFSNNNTITVNNLSSHVNDGVELEESCNNIIIGNNISNNYCGIKSRYNSSNNTIIKNNIRWNNGNGIWFDYYSNNNNNIIGNNIISNNEDGILFIWNSNNNTIIGNNIISNNGCGISLGRDEYGGSNNNTIKGNVISNNGCGISLENSDNTNITGNSFFNDGLWIDFDNSYNATVEDNTVNGKPLVYLEDESDKIITDVGQVILINCDNMTVKNQELSNTSVGIVLWLSHNSLITGNNISNNDNDGIYLLGSNNIINGNTISSNRGNGICLIGSEHNTISANIIDSNNDSGISLVSYYVHPITFPSAYNKIFGNTISNNRGDGIYLEGSTNTISMNTISNNSRGIVLVDCYNIILKNNFITNKIHAFFYHAYFSLSDFLTDLPLTIWWRNYWNRPHLLPKPIFGIIDIVYPRFGGYLFPWLNFDLRPALKPYDIEV